MSSIGHSSLPADDFKFGNIETFTFYTVEAEAFQETQKNGQENWSYHVLHEPVSPPWMSFCQFSSL